MKKYLFIFFTLPVLAFNCKKDNKLPLTKPLFEGTVVARQNGCSSALGDPWIIAFKAANGQPDTLVTITLPNAMKVVGAKITFRQLGPETTPIACFPESIKFSSVSLAIAEYK